MRAHLIVVKSPGFGCCAGLLDSEEEALV